MECANRAKIHDFNAIFQLDALEGGTCTVGNVEVPTSQDCAFVEPLESSNGTLWSTAREKYILLTPPIGYAIADQTCKDKGGGLPMIRNAVEYLALKGKS